MKTFLSSVAFGLVGVVVAVGVLFLFRVPIASWIGPSTDKNTQIVNAVTRTQEGALVTLGIEGIEERQTEDGQLLFLSIPNSRATFVRYSFDAKLGLDAESVEIDVLNWTPFEIDKDEIYNTIFGDDVEAEYLAKNGELLQDQTRAFYSTIAHAIDPDVVLEFEFAQ